MQNQIKQLITQCCRGDSAAQYQLFKIYNNVLFSICLRYAKDKPEAQDMLQDAFLVIYKDLSQYKGEGSFEGWLRKVTIRSVLQHLRKKNPLRFAEEYALMPEHESVTIPVYDESETILQMVQHLPAGYRAVFNMHCIEEMSYTEIAESLGLTESGVRSQYARACASLRNLLDRFLITTT